MAAAWFSSLKRSIKSCKAELSDIVLRNPKDGSNNESRRPSLRRSGCSRSISICHQRDVIHGRNQILNPITHQLVLTNSNCELKITRCRDNDGGCQGDSTFVGTLTPGTPGPGDRLRDGGRSSFSRLRNISSKPRRSFDAESQGFVCQKCGEMFKKLEAIEAHHLSRHAVTPLSEGDSSKKIVELICQTNFLETESKFGQIERILKVHNLQTSLAQFEDYREMVKLKANKQSKEHPRCLADGNELLRFHGTTVACSIGMKTNSTSLCASEKCGVCHILRHGFSTEEEPNCFPCVFTSSTSKRAFKSIELDEDENRYLGKALLVCRVIAGRVYKSSAEDLQEMAAQSSFDSMAANVDSNSNIEELYSLNPKALLPCFVVICKPSKQSVQSISI